MSVEFPFEEIEDFRTNSPVEYITISEGWLDLDRGFFTIVEYQGICVEDFGTTRRQSLRRARKAWRAAFEKKINKEHRYPKERNCSE